MPLELKAVEKQFLLEFFCIELRIQVLLNAWQSHYAMDRLMHSLGSCHMATSGYQELTCVSDAR